MFGGSKAWFAPLFLLVASMLLLPSRQAAAEAPSLAQLGERLYTTGIGTSGKPVVAIDMSGQKVFAPQFHCVSCHRASGYGSKEGGVYIPPIAAPVLYRPMRPDRARAFNGMYFQQHSQGVAGRLEQARTRPAYDGASLGRLLRSGIDPAGQPVPAAMPRYVLSPRDVAALDAWLRTLSARPDPGVDDKTLRFAVIVSDGIPAATRRALIDTARAYVDRFNKDTTSDRSRPNFSPYYRSEFASFWREWGLDVWELHGPQETWPAQLQDYYAKAPVFAVVGGAVAGPWQNVGDFCDTNKVPCLFPLTDLPGHSAREPGYTIYSNGGLPVEGRALAAWLQGNGGGAGRVIQLAADQPAGAMPAEALAQGLTGSAASLKTVKVPLGGWGEAVTREAAGMAPQDTLVIWPGDDDAEQAVAALAGLGIAPARIVLGSRAAAAVMQHLAGGPLASRIRLMRRNEMPGVINPHSYRVRAWLNARRVALDPPDEQFQVYYALSVLEKAVMDIQGDFSRAYLIEEIEMIAESNLNPGVFPYLSLGPGQRFASRGSYVVKLDPAAPGGIAKDGDWIAP